MKRPPGKPPTFGRFITSWYPLAVLVGTLLEVRETANNRLFGDEWRYLWYAKNLLAGYYTPRDNEMIWNGPGYPLLLTPFVAADATPSWARLFNALLLTLAVVYVHRTVLMYCSPARAMVAGLFVALSPLTWETLHLVYTETFALFLMAGFLFHFNAARKERARWHAAVAGVFFGALALTKVAFGPQAFLFLLTAGAFWLWGKRTRLVERSLVCMSIAVVMCLPWLAYTKDVSGKPFYWSSGSGLLFYWMTTPYPDELGDTFHHGNVWNTPFLRERHGSMYKEIQGDPARVANTDLERWMPGVGRLCSVEADGKLWKLGFENLRAHPEGYLRKWLFNVCRLFFNFPRTLFDAFDLKLVLAHLALLGALLVVAVRRIQGRLRMPPALEVIALCSIAATVLATGLSAIARYVHALYPPFLLLALAGVAPERIRPTRRPPKEPPARPARPGSAPD